MTRSEIAAVACRLLAMGMFALAGVAAADVAADFAVERLADLSVRRVVDSPTEFLSPIGIIAWSPTALVGGAVWFLFAVYYVQRSDKLGRLMVGDDPEAVTSKRMVADDITASGCRLIGIALFVYALRSVGWLVSEFAFADREEPFFGPGRIHTALRAAFEAALAIWFLFGSQGIVGLVAWARSAGTERREQPGTESAEAASTARQERSESP
jgi:hypothetical protein